MRGRFSLDVRSDIGRLIIKCVAKVRIRWPRRSRGVFLAYTSCGAVGARARARAEYGGE